MRCRCGFLNSLFFYPTVKVVRIKDRYLGLLRIFFILLALLYIIVFVIIINKGYLAIESPTGSAFTTLQIPIETNLSKYNYCLQNYDVNKEKESTLKNKYLCHVWDEFDDLYPPETLGSMMMTSFVMSADQKQIPNTIEEFPRKFNYTKNFYISGIEKGSIWLRHSMTTDIETKSATQMSGQLLHLDGSVYKKFQANQPDFITLEELLVASESDLDAESDAPLSKGKTFRQTGMVLLWKITYNNLDDISKVTYTYEINRVESTGYNIVNQYILPNQTRKVENRLGIKIVYLQEGQIGAFSLSQTFIQLASGLGLLSVAVVVVDLLMLYVMPKRRLYAEYKFDVSEDFHEKWLKEHGHDESFEINLHKDLAKAKYDNSYQHLNNSPY